MPAITTKMMWALLCEARGHGRLIALFWMTACKLGCRVWLEFVNSDSNWSDGISREFGDDVFAREHGFSTAAFGFDASWLRKTPKEMWREIMAARPVSELVGEP